MAQPKTVHKLAMALPRKRPPIYLGGQTNRNPSRRPGRQPSSPSDFCSCNKNSLQCRAPVAIRNLQRNSDGSWRLHLPSSRGLAVSCGPAWRGFMSSEPRLSFRLRRQALQKHAGDTSHSGTWIGGEINPHRKVIGAEVNAHGKMIGDEVNSHGKFVGD